MTETLRQAVLDETADLRGLDHWELAARLRRLRRLAETQRDSGRVEHGARVTGIDLTDFDDYDRPNTHLSKEED